MEGMPGLDLWETLLQRKVELKFYEDNQATIRTIEMGRSVKLRSIGRTHRINFACYREWLAAGIFTIEYCNTKKQAADIFTKLGHTVEAWEGGYLN